MRGASGMISIVRSCILFFLFTSVCCKRPHQGVAVIPEQTTIHTDSLALVERANKAGNGALLLTRFKTLTELREVVEIKYAKDMPDSAASKTGKYQVSLHYKSGGSEVTSILKSGISQSDFLNAQRGNLWDRLMLGIKTPYAVMNRKNLESIENLGRRRPWVFGKGDVAFYDIAETMVRQISYEDLMSIPGEDLSEKGYLNTFNHITAQAFMTSVFSERLADFVADVHELYNMPELVTGHFTDDQLSNLETGPVDNYIDMINNEWGQELGKVLRQKYGIYRLTYWTPELLKNYLNDILSYNSWAFQIGFQPFRDTDEIVIQFANKMNKVILDE